MDSATPLTKDLVLIGGGHAHALVLRAWGMKPVPGARLTVVHPGPTAAYSGMLPGHVAGHYTRDDLDIDVVRLARFAGARLVLGAANGLDRAEQVVHVPGRAPIPYDVCSIDIGVTAEMPRLPGFAEHGIPAKPLDTFAARWESFVAKVARGEAAPEVALIGGGVAGMELALAMQHRLAGLGCAPKVTVLDSGAVLQAVSGSVRAVLFEAARKADIAIRENVRVAEVTADGVVLEGEERPLTAGFVTGAAGARPHDWLAHIGLEHRDGYPVVDATLRSVTDKAIYLAGDCAHMGFAPRPKAGVYAVRQAPVLGWNLRADLTGAARKTYRPQKDFLKLISLGGQNAVADWHGFGPSGPALWRWKDKIDRAFMDKLDHLPAMPRPNAPKGAAKGVAKRMGGQPPCGGCGAKLGANPLAQALAGVGGLARPDVLQGVGDDAAVLQIGDARQVICVDHLRGLNLDPATHTRITAIHALGDVWAMGAQPQAALTSVILPRMSERMQAATLAEVMAVASEVFGAEGAQVVGGHSSEGTELTVGFTVTGLLDGPAVPKAIPQAGLALILTRPLGSGTLLAAEMQARARGADVLHALEVMGQSQAQAASILASDALAMTDVTGFGLAGHLWEMLREHGLSASLNRVALPIYPGALDLAQEGLRSILFPANRAALAGVFSVAEGDATAALLCDPQTAGGLLAAVPVDRADALAARLRNAGAAEVAVVGQVVETGAGGPAITLEGAAG